MSKFDNKHKPELPKSYFSNLESRITEIVSEEDSFRMEDFPMLSSIQKNTFTTPRNYFSEMNASTFYVKKKTIGLFQKLAIAAMLLIAVSIFTLSKNQMIEPEQSIALGDDSSFDFLSQDFDALELSDINDILIDEETSINLDLGSVDNNDIINYLLDESDQYDLAFDY